jgi:hypothetical protein
MEFIFIPAMYNDDANYLARALLLHLLPAGSKLPETLKTTKTAQEIRDKAEAAGYHFVNPPLR